MGLFNLGGGSAGASLQLPESDGYLVNIGGNLVTVELDAVWPARIKNPGARGGHSLFEVRPWLGEARDLDLATTGDKPIRIEAFMSVFREIIVGLTTDTPVGCVASIWTGPNKTGDKLTDLSADNLSTLVSWKAMLPVIVPDLPRVCDYIYLNVEKASANPCLISVLVYGRVIIANEETGLVP
ncbi:hypothetical protein [Methylobacterium sp. Leaf91]|uniref:hypothetical protein n=1 Tax=unclassified Methylobacterium TaxID=2615210 RepID=UPI0006FF08A2|nr:hypothetical protein [Methylobacterium sp. Leaf91]KQO99090.1 hypothetical protein ASF32_14645 [Methylobacterium sp. Leaf91]